MAELKNPPSQRMVQKDLQSLREMGIVSRTSSAKNTFWTIDTE